MSCLCFVVGQEGACGLLAELKIPVELVCLLRFCYINCEWLSCVFLSSNAGALRGIMFRGDVGFVPCAVPVPASLAVFPFGSFVCNNLLRVVLRSPRGTVIVFGFLRWCRGFYGFLWPWFGRWWLLEMADCPCKCINFCLQCNYLAVRIVRFPLTQVFESCIFQVDFR